MSVPFSRPRSNVARASLTLLRRVAAVDEQAGSGYEGCGRRREVDDGADDIVNRPHPPERDATDRVGAEFGVRKEPAGHRGLYLCRRDRVDADAPRREIERHRLGEPLDAMLARAVGGPV